MAWLIVRIEPIDNDVKPEGMGEPVVAFLRQRISLKEVASTLSLRAPALAAKYGFEVDLPLGSHDPETWPYLAYIYTSLNKEGNGRSGTVLHRWPARKPCVLSVCTRTALSKDCQFCHEHADDIYVTTIGEGKCLIELRDEDSDYAEITPKMLGQFHKWYASGGGELL